MGTIWAKSGTFEFDNNGERAIGAKAYFFDPGTSTPRATYQDADLSTAHAHPVESDGFGRWPAVFLQYGSYDNDVTTSGGTTLWTADEIPNPEPTDTSDSVDANSIFQTGDILFVGKNGTRAGFVRCGGRTIGSAASGATERANADCADLYAYLWNNYSNSACPVTTGRGGSAASDFAANKPIGTPDGRATVLAGFDDMGNTALTGYNSAPVIGGSGILPGSVLGSPIHTILTANLPATTPAGSISAVTGTITQSPITPAGTITQSPITPAGSVGISDTRTWGATRALLNNVANGGSDGATGQAGATDIPVTVKTGSISGSFTGTPQTLTFAGTSQTLTFSGNAQTFTGTPFGSGTAMNIMQRTTPVTVLMKL